MDHSRASSRSLSMRMLSFDEFFFGAENLRPNEFKKVIVRVILSIQEYSRVFKSFQEYSRVFKSIQDTGWVFKSIQDTDWVFKN